VTTSLNGRNIPEGIYAVSRGGGIEEKYSNAAF
jgi:hypothetical protein